MLPVKIIGTGIYAPGTAISNAELMALTGLEFNAEKLESKLGIKKRHMAHLRGIPETTADFATFAIQDAIRNAGVKAEEIGLFAVGTDTPEYISPSTAILVQGRIQGEESWAVSFDVNASCASFTIALDNAVRILSTDSTIRYAAVVGVYNMPAFIRKDDAFGYSIFADGAGAVILGRSEDGKSGYIGSQMLTDGTQHDYIGVYAGGTKMPVTRQVLDENRQGLLSLQPLPGDRNIRLWPMIVKKLLAKYDQPVEGIDHFIFTQINRSVILEVMGILGVSADKTTTIMDRYAYTGSACVPMALHHAATAGRIVRGDKIVLMASGAGLAVGSNLFIY